MGNRNVLDRKQHLETLSERRNFLFFFSLVFIVKVVSDQAEQIDNSLKHVDAPRIGYRGERRNTVEVQ